MLPASRQLVQRPASLSIKVPDKGWHLRITHIFELPDSVWICAVLHRNPGLAAQMISQAEASIPITLPEKPARVFVAGKTWAWPNDEPYTFVGSLDPVIKEAGPARLLFRSKTDGCLGEAALPRKGA